jgi:hypothetical protein
MSADGSYPDVAARAVASASQQTPSPIYGYLRVGTQQKIYLFGTLEQGSGWLATIVHAQAQPYDYAAVFAATDLTRPVPGMESFGHTVVSGGVGTEDPYRNLGDREAREAVEARFREFPPAQRDDVAFWRFERKSAIADFTDQATRFLNDPLNRYSYLWGTKVALARIAYADRELARLHAGGTAVGVGSDGSYPEVAARAVTNAAQQAASPLYGYVRLGAQQKVYLFGAIGDAQQWLGAFVHGQAPYEYAAVFAATDLSRPIAGMESFAHTAVSGAYIGADGSYPEVAARAVTNAAQQAASPLYGYVRLGAQQKVYLFGAIGDAQQWLGSIVNGQSPYDYVAIFAAPNLSHPLPGMESFGRAAISGTYVGSLLPFLLGLPLGGLAGYFLRRWQEENPGHTLPGVSPGVLKAPSIPPTAAKTSGDYNVGGPWLDIEAPYVGGPWLDMVGPQVGGPWLDMVGPQVGGPWLDMVGPQVGASMYPSHDRPYHGESEADRKRKWPQTRALIEAAKREAVDYNAAYPAAALVWSLDPSGPSSVPGVQLTGGTTMTMPFSSYAEALDYMRSRVQTPHVALALFDTTSPHWPNPMSWTKSDDPVYAQIIAERTGTVRTAGDYGSTAIGSALDDVRKKAEDLAARRAGNVIGVIHTAKDDLWHVLAFHSADDADDWLNTATQDPASYTYAAYFDKHGDSWPHAYIEKISGMRAAPGTEVPRRSASVGWRHRHGWAA